MRRVVDASAYEELEAAVARALVAEIRSASNRLDLAERLFNPP
jgi:hypothetical protein